MDKVIEERLNYYVGKPLPMKFQEVNGPFPVVTEVENWEEEKVDEELVKLVLDNSLTGRFLSDEDIRWWDSNYWRQVNEGYFGDPPPPLEKEGE